MNKIYYNIGKKWGSLNVDTRRKEKKDENSNNANNVVEIVQWLR